MNLPPHCTNHIRRHYSTTHHCQPNYFHLYCSIKQQEHIVESFSRLNMNRDLHCWQAKSRHYSVASTAFEELYHYQMKLSKARQYLLVLVAQCLKSPLGSSSRGSTVPNTIATITRRTTATPLKILTRLVHPFFSITISASGISPSCSSRSRSL